MEMREAHFGGAGPHRVNSAPRCSGHAGGMADPMRPHPTSQSGYSMGGRVGEWAKQPKVPTMRSIGGKAAEGGTATQKQGLWQG